MSWRTPLMRILITVLLTLALMSSTFPSVLAQSGNREGVVVVTVVNSNNETIEKAIAIVTLSRSTNPLASSADPSTIYVTDLRGNPLYYNVTVTSVGTIEVRILIQDLKPYSVSILLLHYGGANPYRSYALSLSELEKRASSASELKDDFNTASSLWSWTDLWSAKDGYAVYTSNEEAPRFPQPPRSLISRSLDIVCAPTCMIAAKARSIGVPAYDMRISIQLDGKYWLTFSFISWRENSTVIEVKGFTAKGVFINLARPLSKTQLSGVDTRNLNGYIITIDSSKRVARVCINSKCVDFELAIAPHRITSIALGSKGKSLWDFVYIRGLLSKLVLVSNVISYEELLALRSVLIDPVLKATQTLNSTVSELSSRISELGDDLGSVIAEVETLKKELEKARSSLSELSGRVEAVDKEMKSSISEIERSIEGITTRVNSLSSALSGFQQRLNALRDSIAKINATIAKLALELDKTRSAVSAVESKMSSAESRISELEKKSSNIEQKLSQIEKNLSDQLGKLSSEIKELKNMSSMIYASLAIAVIAIFIAIAVVLARRR